MKGEALFLKMLGDETRLKIIKQLLKGEVCACKLIPSTKRAQSTVSKHLSDLEKAEILKSRRDGRCIYYSIKDMRVFKLCKIMCIK